MSASEAHLMSAFENIGYGPWNHPHPNSNVNGGTPNNSPVHSPTILSGSLHPFMAYGNSNHTWHGAHVNGTTYTPVNGVHNNNNNHHHHHSPGGILMKPLPMDPFSQQTHL